MEQETGVSCKPLLGPSVDITLLADDVRLLKDSGRPFDSQTAKAALDVLLFLDWALLDWAESNEQYKLPRDYFYEITGISNQVCLWRPVDSEEAAGLFAADVATGFLEELCEVVGAELSATLRPQLGL
jgi:hypothetical protein